jgi:hypothetical protein
MYYRTNDCSDSSKLHSIDYHIEVFHLCKLSDFNFLELKPMNIVKIIFSVKVACFLIISAIESGYNIYQSIKFDDCVLEVSLVMDAKNLRNPSAKAIHYCEGGNLVGLDD